MAGGRLELVDQNASNLRTTLDFRRAKPPVPWRTIALVAGFVLLIASIVTIGAVLEGNGDKGNLPPTAAPSTENRPEGHLDTYSYKGPKYEIVIVDEHVSRADLKQYWVLTRKFDYSSDAYKDQIKLIIGDIARKQRTDKLVVEVVTKKEIAFAESRSTYEEFVEEHGLDYALKTIPQIEKNHYAATFTGGYDPDTLEPSDADKAFEIAWYLGSQETEKWRPEA